MPPRKRQQLPAAAAFQTVSLQPPPPPFTPPLSLALEDDDLLMEILLRLPAKSLTRFKCVCKKWVSLISSDYFCHHHTLRRPKLQPSILLQTCCLGEECFYLNPTITVNGEKKMIPYSPSLPIPYHGYEIVQACNGLMLLKLTHSYGDPIKISYCIYNPTTRRSREIMSFYNDYYLLVAMGLAFDPSKSPYYKIVCIKSVGEEDSDLYTVEVYDSESHTWKLCLESFIEHSPFDTDGTYGTYWNDAIYWRFHNCESHYICFDIGKNEVKTLSLPENPPDFDVGKHDCFDYYLQESDGHLYHFEYFNERTLWEDEYDKELVIVSVWELVGDDDSQWIFKDHHRLTCTEGCHPYYILRWMGGSGSGSGSDGDGTCSLLTCWEGKMRAYSFLDKSYQDILDFMTHPDYRRPLNVQYFQFGEVLSLV